VQAARRRFGDEYLLTKVIGRGRSFFQAGHSATQQPAEPDEATEVMATIIATIISISTWLLVVAGVAYFYKRSYLSAPVDVEKAQVAFKDQGFVHGPFECHEDIEILAWSCFCGGIRWADTMQAISMLTFWVALALFMVTAVLDAFTGGLLMWIVVSVCFTYYRQEIRRKFLMKNDGEDQVKDFAMWCCCACCAIAQEARHIKEMPKLTKEGQAVAFQA